MQRRRRCSSLPSRGAQARILAGIAEFLGEQALTPEVYYESDFGSEEWTRGAYATSYDLGGLSASARHQNDAVGPIHLASSDLAGEGYQHVDGAVRMGRRTAARIVAALAEPPTTRPTTASVPVSAYRSMPSVARYVVGYTADERGAEALPLGARLAGTDGSTELDLVIALPEHTPFEAGVQGQGPRAPTRSWAKRQEMGGGGPGAWSRRGSGHRAGPLRSAPRPRVLIASPRNARRC